MANKNLAKLVELSNTYGVSVQALYTKEALEKGNMEVVHKAFIGGQEYTCLQQYSYEKLENLFKSIALGNMKIHTPENTVVFGQNTDTVSINGRRYKIFDIVKNVSFEVINDMVNNNYSNGTEWQVEYAKKIREWFKNGGFVQWLEYQYEKEYGETVDEYAQRMDLIGV